MSSKALTDEQKEKYENDFKEFLIDRIKRLSGLQFQHLANLLPQLNFEVREALGSSKVQLMRFLKSNPKLFNVNSKGFVTVIDTSMQCEKNDEDYNEEPILLNNCSLPLKIKKGSGKISKLYNEFGLINAVIPIKTKVYFRGPQYSGDKDSILSTLDIKVGLRVHFDAVIGSSIYNVKYHATKVWTQVNNEDPSYYFSFPGKSREDSYMNSQSDAENVNKIAKKNEFKSEGAQKKSKTNKQKKTVYSCTEDSFDDDNKSLSNNVRRKKEIMKNVHGKISPHVNGVNILFGKKFSEIVDGNSSAYFLYESKVAITDIAWEFSDGDDVCFDAVKINSSQGWKAVLVWIGDRPDVVLTDEEPDETPKETNSCTPVFHSSKKNIQTNANDYNIDELQMKENLEHNAIINTENALIEQRNFESSRSSSLTSLSSRGSNNTKKQRKNSKQKNFTYNESKPKQTQKEKIKYNSLRDYNDTFSCPVSEDTDYMFEKQNVTKFQTSSEHSKSHRNKQNKKNLNSSKNESDIDDNSECSEIMSKLTNINFDEYEPKMEGNEEAVHNVEGSEIIIKNYGKANIKKYRNIEGEITKVFCKVAYCRNPNLQAPVHFLPNTFYCNGESVEDLQLEDLRESLSDGDIVELNCFEIVDDFGKLHQKVTLAYIGEEPKISEITPEKFIIENNLSVNINAECDVQNFQPVKNSCKKFLNPIDMADSDEKLETRMFIKTSSKNSSDDEISSSSNYITALETQDYNILEKEMKLPADYRLLSEMISQKLKRKSLSFLTSKVDLNVLSTEIVDLIVCKHQNAEKSNYLQMNMLLNEKNNASKLPACSLCTSKRNELFSDNLENKEVQTIITGDIVAQSIFIEP